MAAAAGAALRDSRTGFINRTQDNMCWFNVGANAVARDPVGSQWLMEKVDAGLVPATSASDSESCMTTLLRVCHDMSQAGRAVHLHDLLHQVGLYNPQLVILNEQDKQLASQPHQDWTEGLESILGMLAENIPPELQQELFRSTFSFLVQTYFICAKCGACKTTAIPQPGWVLHLDFSRTTVTLGDALEEYFFAKHLVDKLECSASKEKESGKECSRMSRLPPTLIISLERAAEIQAKSAVKDNRQFRYPAELDMRRYSTDSALLDGWGSKYQLGRVLKHIGGSASGGHFQFVQRLTDGSWVVRDDDKPPKPISQQEALSLTFAACGLIYFRVPPNSVLQSGCPTPQNIPSFSMMDGIGGTELLSCPIALDTLPLHKTPRNELTPEQQEERAQRKAVSDLKRLQLANAQALRDNQCAAEQQHVKEEKEAQERLAKRQERDALCRLRQRQVEIEAKRAKAKAEQQSREQQLRRAANAVKREEPAAPAASPSTAESEQLKKKQAKAAKSALLQARLAAKKAEKKQAAESAAVRLAEQASAAAAIHQTELKAAPIQTEQIAAACKAEQGAADLQKAEEQAAAAAATNNVRKQAAAVMAEAKQQAAAVASTRLDQESADCEAVQKAEEADVEERNVTMEVACSTPPVMVKKTTFVGLTKKQLTQANLATLRKAANQGKDAALVKRAQNEAAVLKAANMAEAEAAVVAAKHAEVKAALVAARMADEQAAAAAVNPAEVADVAPTHLPKRHESQSIEAASPDKAEPWEAATAVLTPLSPSSSQSMGSDADLNDPLVNMACTLEDAAIGSDPLPDGGDGGMPPPATPAVVVEDTTATTPDIGNPSLQCPRGDTILADGAPSPTEPIVVLAAALSHAFASSDSLPRKAAASAVAAPPYVPATGDTLQVQSCPAGSAITSKPLVPDNPEPELDPVKPQPADNNASSLQKANSFIDGVLSHDAVAGEVVVQVQQPVTCTVQTVQSDTWDQSVADDISSTVAAAGEDLDSSSHDGNGTNQAQVQVATHIQGTESASSKVSSADAAMMDDQSSEAAVSSRPTDCDLLGLTANAEHAASVADADADAAAINTSKPTSLTTLEPLQIAVEGHFPTSLLIDSDSAIQEPQAAEIRQPMPSYAHDRMDAAERRDACSTSAEPTIASPGVSANTLVADAIVSASLVTQPSLVDDTSHAFAAAPDSLARLTSPAQGHPSAPASMEGSAALVIKVDAERDATPNSPGLAPHSPPSEGEQRSQAPSLAAAPAPKAEGGNGEDSIRVESLGAAQDADTRNSAALSPVNGPMTKQSSTDITVAAPHAEQMGKAPSLAAASAHLSEIKGRHVDTSSEGLLGAVWHAESQDADILPSSQRSKHSNVTHAVASAPSNFTNAVPMSDSIEADAASIEASSPFADATSLESSFSSAHAASSSVLDDSFRTDIDPVAGLGLISKAPTSSKTAKLVTADADITAAGFVLSSAHIHTGTSTEGAAESAESSCHSAGLTSAQNQISDAAADSVPTNADKDQLQMLQPTPDVTAGAGPLRLPFASVVNAEAVRDLDKACNHATLTASNANADVLPADLPATSTTAAATAGDNDISPVPVDSELPRPTRRRAAPLLPAHHAPWDTSRPACDLTGIFNGWHGGQMPDDLRLAFRASRASGPPVVSHASEPLNKRGFWGCAWRGAKGFAKGAKAAAAQVKREVQEAYKDHPYRVAAAGVTVALGCTAATRKQGSRAAPRFL